MRRVAVQSDDSPAGRDSFVQQIDDAPRPATKIDRAVTGVHVDLVEQCAAVRSQFVGLTLESSAFAATGTERVDLVWIDGHFVRSLRRLARQYHRAASRGEATRGTSTWFSHWMRDQVTIRSAGPGDLATVVAIYNAGIVERMATFETDLRTTADITGWLEDGQPFVVAELDGRIVGWARAGAYSDRCVYQGIGEHAVYVDPAARGRGLGCRLLAELCAEAEQCGLYKLTSRVFADNHPSRAAHRAAGFEEVGIQRRHGRLDGEWKDCVLVERLIGPAAD